MTMIFKGEKPNIVLASYPRSGNTFLRNVMYEVYGIYSWNNIDVFNNGLIKYEDLTERKKRKGVLGEHAEEKLLELTFRFKYKALKSHELPSKTLKLCDKDAKVIYLVRDGRDALVSMAHHRKDIVEPGTDFLKNLKESINPLFGTYFGGWSHNVEEWSKIANIVIKFEDFIKDPLRFTESFREFMEMPEPKTDKLPTFESQKNGSAHFGGSSRKRYSDEEKKEFNNKFFRKGQVNGWKTEMPEKMQKLFWKKHGKTMEKMGYLKNV